MNAQALPRCDRGPFRLRVVRIQNQQARDELLNIERVRGRVERRVRSVGKRFEQCPGVEVRSTVSGEMGLGRVCACKAVDLVLGLLGEG
jgi:hypothetical protein